MGWIAKRGFGRMLSMKKLICGTLALALMAGAVMCAAGTPSFEVRKQSAIGRMGLVNVEVAVRAEADGSLLASFQAPDAGTYILVYTSGRDTGKTATRINVNRPGPVTAKIK
jgi:hypothetical protein